VQRGGTRGDNRRMSEPHPDRPPARPLWQRAAWAGAGGLCLVLGVIGIFVPLLPTTPFVLLAAFCFSRGSTRVERWLLAHPRFGPMVVDWRARRAVPRRAKQLATLMMTLGSAWSWWVMPAPWRWLPPLCCAAVALWLWRLPDAGPAAAAPARRS
jgi:uncharacterized protein